MTSTFDVKAFLDSAGVARRIVELPRDRVIYAQGDPCEEVMYIQIGTVKLSVVSNTGREAVVAMLGTGDFFGEGCLAGQPVRMGSATAITDGKGSTLGQVSQRYATSPSRCSLNFVEQGPISSHERHGAQG